VTFFTPLAWLYLLLGIIGILPGILAAAKGAGPCMVFAAITSLLSLLNLFVATTFTFGLVFVPNYRPIAVIFILTCLGLLFAWAAILEERRRTVQN
jgi:hypothetical protein